MHWLCYVGLTVAVMIVLWMLIGALVSAWNWEHDNLTYGYPRLSQTDAVVGQADSAAHPSHFIALNWHDQVEVIEFPGGDASHAKVYFGPKLVGPGQDLVPVTLTFKEVNGDVDILPTPRRAGDAPRHREGFLFQRAMHEGLSPAHV